MTLAAGIFPQVYELVRVPVSRPAAVLINQITHLPAKLSSIPFNCQPYHRLNAHELSHDFTVHTKIRHPSLLSAGHN